MAVSLFSNIDERVDAIPRLGSPWMGNDVDFLTGFQPIVVFDGEGRFVTALLQGLPDLFC
jgi:hypothetical protein